MSKINIHPTDRIATFQEVSKQIGLFTVVILIFIFVFFIPMSQGSMSTETCNEITLECEVVDDDIFSVVIGYALSGCFSLILIAIWSQVLMAIIGKGKFVIDENNSVTLRTSKSGTRKPGRLDFIGRIIQTPFANMIMNDADKDGDRKISFDEFIEEMFQDVGSKSEFQEMKDEFDRYDTDGDGYITYRELQDSIISGGENWAEEKPDVEDKPDDWWSEEN